MTQEQTRQLGVEFERRLYEIYPEFKVKDKLTTDTIYSILSEFCIQFVNGLFMTTDKIENNSIGVVRINDVSKTLIKHARIACSYENPDFDFCTACFEKPEDYYIYVRSSSEASKTYKTKNKTGDSYILPNNIIKQQDVPNVINTYVNNNAIIRYPMVVLESTEKGIPYIKVIHDSYTDIDELDLTYYCQPYRFNIINYNDKDMSEGAVHSYCQLPYSIFDDIVEGAINLYISQYKFRLLGGSNNQKQQKQQEDEQ